MYSQQFHNSRSLGCWTGVKVLQFIFKFEINASSWLSKKKKYCSGRAPSLFIFFRLYSMHISRIHYSRLKITLNISAV